MRQHIQIKYCYKIWDPAVMEIMIWVRCHPYKAKNYAPYIIEWWLHNIGYYLTLPYIDAPKIKALNDRFKHVDLMVKCEGKNEGIEK